MENTNDHDLLIELRTEMRGLRNDVKENNLNFGTTIKDHETRIRGLESSVTKILTWGTIGMVVLGVVEFFISKFF